MATTWARAEVILDANGELLPSQVRQFATRAGNEGGDAASSSFASSFNRTLGPRLSGVFRGIGNSLRNMGRDADDTSGRMNNLATSLRRLSFRFGNTVPMLRFRYALMDIGRFGREAFQGMGDELNRLSNHMAEVHQRGEHQISMWKRLSHNTRQWTLIIGAVIASMSELAGLGSAAGSGLFVLGGALAAMIPGIGVLIAAFSVFSKNIDELPEIIRPARAAMSRLGEAFKDLGNDIAISVFEDTADAFDSLRDTVRALTPAFQSVGRVVNRLFKDFAASVAPGTKVFENLLGFIEKSGPIFDRVIRIVGTLGAALLVAFNNPSFQRSLSEFIGWIETLTNRFATFLSGPGFDEWLAHGRTVFGEFGELLDTVGGLLNDMVTDETIARLAAFIDNIDTFLQTGGQGILDFAQELDIFGIIAQALAEFGEALEPLHEPMALLAGAIRQVFDSGIQQLGPIVEDVATALAPFVTALADFIAQNPEGIASGLLLIAGAFVVLKGAQGILGLSGMVGTFIGKMDDIVAKKAIWLGALAGIAAGIITALPGAEDGAISGNDVVTGFTNAMILGFMVGGPVGAGIAFIASLFTSMIQDMFFDNTRGVWEIGWQQIIDFNNSQIGLMFFGLQERAVAGMISVVAGFVVGFENLNTAASTGWNNVVNFFTVQVPGFFQRWGAGIVAGFLSVVAGFVVGLQNTHTAASTGWQNVVNFFTTAIPNAFNGAVQGISSGVGRMAAAFDNAFPGVAGVIRYWIGVIGDLIGRILDFIGQAQSAAGQAANMSAGGGGGRGFLSQASGGIHYGPTRVLMGEAGPEAIVPLNRALSQVDPSVRWLSAIAQGKGTPAMAGGGIVGGGKQVNVEAGAFVIQEAGDGRRTANDVLTRIAEFVYG